MSNENETKYYAYHGVVGARRETLDAEELAAVLSDEDRGAARGVCVIGEHDSAAAADV